MNPDQPTTGSGPQTSSAWALFWGYWCSLGVVGLVATYFLMPSFGMMSDSCHTGSAGYLCNGGDPLFAMLPLIGYVSMMLISPLAGAVANEGVGGRRLPPEWGFAVGILMWWLTPYLVWHHAVAAYNGR